MFDIRVEQHGKEFHVMNWRNEKINAEVITDEDYANKVKGWVEQMIAIAVAHSNKSKLKTIGRG